MVEIIFLKKFHNGLGAEQYGGKGLSLGHLTSQTVIRKGCNCSTILVTVVKGTAYINLFLRP